MNTIIKTSLEGLGYNFIDARYIPKGKDEYYLRFQQNPDKERYRQLTPKEIEELVRNGNRSDNWGNVLVSDKFNPSLVQQCDFYGLIRIGNLENYYLQFHDFRLAVGLYHSTIISCDLGDNVAINNVNYISHYIIGNEVIIVNVNEIEVSNHAKFGNGILRKDEKEAVRVWLEVCNENAGRSILPFNGMQTGDAWLWSRNREDEQLMEQFKKLTENQFDNKRGWYGTIGDRTVIKNSRIIKDVNIGTDAYIKGANKLKNLTINSSSTAPTQIGEGCELVNGIMGFGCKAFYGVKAVRFFLASHSQLKYGARLINSFLGDNSTISCCEVLNSLIFPAHEQHHNNSFLCAATLQGQSNMAAGATIGSNHNSRGADGELIAGRGFWPGLCVSLKHNSLFASYTMLAKGDYPAELHISIPFSLVSNDVSNNKLVIMPGYWFMYNMYALARNSGKYATRDNRTLKNQHLEYDFLAPDTINELFTAIAQLEKVVGESYTTAKLSEKEAIKKGRALLEKKKVNGKKQITAIAFENSNRSVELIKVPEAYRIFKELVIYHGVTQLMYLLESNNIGSLEELWKLTGKLKRSNWSNIGGQLVPDTKVNGLLEKIRSGSIKNWDEIHDHYHQWSDQYLLEKAKHGIAALLEMIQLPQQKFTTRHFVKLLQEALLTKEWMTKGIYESRAKDYSNPFRKMIYATNKEMEKIVGSLKDNTFISQQQEELKKFRHKVTALSKTLKTESR